MTGANPLSSPVYRVGMTITKVTVSLNLPGLVVWSTFGMLFISVQSGKLGRSLPLLDIANGPHLSLHCEALDDDIND